MVFDADKYRERILYGSIVRTILWLAWPIIVSNAVQMTYNLVDAIWLGRLGREAFGAPTVSWPIIMLFNAIGIGFAQAGMALVSQYFGAGDREMTSRVVCQLIAFHLILALLISIVGSLTIDAVLRFIGVPSDVYPHAVTYARTILLAIPIAFMSMAIIVILNALGDTRTVMKLTVVSALINIVLDPVLIFGLFGFPRLEVLGAALATIVARSFVAGIGVYMLVQGIHGIKLRLSSMRIEKWLIRKVLSIGIPISIQSSSTALGFTVLMGIVSRFGSIAIAAYGVGIRVLDFVQAFTFGIQRAASIMVGQCIGAELYTRARRVANVSMLLIASALGIGATAIYLLREVLVSLFVPDPEVVVEGSRFLGVFTWSLPFFGIFFVCNGIAQGSGHPQAMTGIAIARLWVFRIGLSLLLALYMGMGSMGIWIAMTVSNIAAALLSLAWVFRGTWLQRVIVVESGISKSVVNTAREHS